MIVKYINGLVIPWYMDDKKVMYVMSGFFQLDESELKDYTGVPCKVFEDSNFLLNLDYALSELRRSNGQYNILVVDPFQYIYPINTTCQNHASNLKTFLSESRNFGIEKIIFSSNRSTILDLDTHGFKLNETHDFEVIQGNNYLTNLINAIHQ